MRATIFRDQHHIFDVDIHHSAHVVLSSCLQAHVLESALCVTEVHMH